MQKMKNIPKKVSHFNYYTLKHRFGVLMKKQIIIMTYEATDLFGTFIY